MSNKCYEHGDVYESANGEVEELPTTLTLQETELLEKYERNKKYHFTLHYYDCEVTFTLAEIVQLTKLVNNE